MKALTVLLLIFVSFGSTALASTPLPPQIETHFFGSVSLDRLSAGEPGIGTLLYFPPERDVNHPSLVVRLSKQANTEHAVAQVYDAPADKNYVPVTISGLEVTLDPALLPAVTFTAPDGWWVRNGVTNYNLDIRVNGPVYAMWGAGYDPKFGPLGWAQYMKPGQPAVDIMVRDPQHEGVPLWDLRTLIPPFKYEGYYRVSYAERKCKSSLAVEPSPAPLWPFIAAKGGFEQPAKTLRPPIVVNWAAGRITQFAELVTVRNQSCSYALYSIDPLSPGQLNKLNFETPFAFYDLSNEHKGLPNLILRTEHFPNGNFWSAGIDQSVQQGRPVDRDIERIRYSWRLAPGDNVWDYKVEVGGFHPYTSETPIAGGAATIDAPSYEQFPGWVMERSWPAVTFVDTENTSYRSSEGIYDYDPYAIGIGYILGWDEKGNLGEYRDIADGFRGEYRFKQDRHVQLYVSPIDNQVHLVGAEGGVWRLSQGQVLRERRLGDGDEINWWAREIEPARGNQEDIVVEESLYAADGYLLYANTNGIELHKADYRPSALALTPPTGHASWQSFRDQIAPYKADKRDPKDLQSWFEHFAGASFAARGAQVEDVTITNRGFSFVVTLQPGFEITKHELFDMGGLEAGSYVVTYDGQFHVTPLAQPAISATVIQQPITALQQGKIGIALDNPGPASIERANLELWAAAPNQPATLVTSQTVTLLAQEPITATLTWAPSTAGEWTLTPIVRQTDGQELTFDATTVDVRPAAILAPLSLIDTSTSARVLPFAVGTLILLAGLASLVFLRQWGVTPGEHTDV